MMSVLTATFTRETFDPLSERPRASLPHSPLARVDRVLARVSPRCRAPPRPSRRRSARPFARPFARPAAAPTPAARVAARRGPSSPTVARTTRPSARAPPCRLTRPPARSRADARSRPRSAPPPVRPPTRAPRHPGTRRPPRVSSLPHPDASASGFRASAIVDDRPRLPTRAIDRSSRDRSLGAFASISGSSPRSRLDRSPPRPPPPSLPFPRASPQPWARPIVRRSRRSRAR